MANAEKFNSYSKADLYKIYCQLYQKLAEKDSLIAEHVVTVSEFLKNSQETASSSIITPKINTIAKNDVFIQKFETIKFEEKTENFLVGRSIIKLLAGDRTFPHDCSIHAYKGSTTKEKRKHCNYYTVTIKKDENSHFTRWDQCYSKTKK